MSKKPIYLSSIHQGGAESKYIQAALNSNSLSTGGINVSEFEKAVEHYIGQGNFVAALSSGTAAIHLGLILLGVKKGDEVICQSLTFSASANPIVYQGATPIFVDSESETWNICPITLEEAIMDRILKGSKPKAIIAVHLYGMPYKVDAVHAVATKYGIPILEDSAEALGSTYKNTACGTFGDIGVYSFNGNKIITTSGGGALVVKDQKVKQKAIFYATQAKEPTLYYQHNEIGYNYRMPNICAAVGQAQMEVLDEHIKLRKANHLFYELLFKDINCVGVHKALNEDSTSNYWLTTIIIDPKNSEGFNSENLRMALQDDSVEARPIWKPMHLQPIFEKSPYYGNNAAEELFNNGLCLPSSSNLTDEDKDRIRKVVLKYFKKTVEK
ncbi:pyridoxal phosphate-dependent aminotransferase [Flavobacterium faecale]|uniref:Pyridoxal phosphate-dependent aminotransferase n=1 Tax=Flavobacterium faecale TaxID=1355330 RepID=A0A2S1LCK8_9FLAO|nr:aminotransferase class I/II-fold pyridoxal phosphate-dependent enzyme [Flavobacterium faecale]AWG21438.1 pyridoxal phosphate-dependent aminotransferase [Flavobacterium faecale]